MSLIEWLREAWAEYECEPVAVFRKRGTHDWPLEADSEDDLARKLEAGGHFLALPKSPRRWRTSSRCRCWIFCSRRSKG